MKDPSR